MDLLNLIWTNGAAAIFILTVIVFGHEFGHYIVARWCGVRVEVFSVGFGPEILGWTDSHGTRWKISLLPLGGYVKMFGENDDPDGDGGGDLTADEIKVSFRHKKLFQKAAIVSAGPVANFILAVIVFAVLFSTVGQRFTPPDVGAVAPDSAAEAAGFKPGDKFLRIDSTDIERFEDIQQIVRMSPGKPLRVIVKRGERELEIVVTPKLDELTDRFGNKHEIGLLGISRKGTDSVRHDPATAVARAVLETYRLSLFTLDAIGQIIMGKRSSKDLGGPIRIFQLAGQFAEGGLATLFWFVAVLSINLGLINLFPVPMLDGGHLLFFAVEGVRRKPLSDKVVDYGFRIGLTMIIALFVFVTYQDLKRIPGVVDFFKRLIS